MTRTSQNQREDIFNLPHPSTPELEGLDLSRGLPGGVVTGQIEPRIMKCSHFIATNEIYFPTSMDIHAFLTKETGKFSQLFSHQRKKDYALSHFQSSLLKMALSVLSPKAQKLKACSYTKFLNRSLCLPVCFFSWFV